MAERVSSLIDLVDRLSILVDCYESISLLTAESIHVPGDRVSVLLIQVNDGLSSLLRELELLREGGQCLSATDPRFDYPECPD